MPDNLTLKFKEELERSLKNNVTGHDIKNREELFRLDLKGESAA